MVLKFMPPLDEHEQAIFASLPKLNNCVVHPQHYPHNLQAAANLELQAWCDSHPQSDWPRWVMDWHINRTLEQQQAARKVGKAT